VLEWGIEGREGRLGSEFYRRARAMEAKTSVGLMPDVKAVLEDARLMASNTRCFQMSSECHDECCAASLSRRGRRVGTLTCGPR
jgi:hypothetical protein